MKTGKNQYRRQRVSPWQVCLLGLLFVVTLAGGDTIYLRSGKQLKGSAVKQSDTYVITLADGSKQTLPASEVLYVASDKKPVTPPVTAPTTPTTPTTPATPAAPAASSALDRHDLSTLGVKGQFRVSTATLPEAAVFHYLRQGRGRADIEKKIAHYRALAHDQKRQVNGKWLAPYEYAARRRKYLELVKEAYDDLKRVKDPKKKTLTIREKMDNAKYKAGGFAKLKQAARAWPDPLFRLFLLGVANAQGDDYTAATQCFRGCVLRAPGVAAFYQGRAKAYLEKGRYAEALKDYLTLATLKPDEPEVASLLAKALKATPGNAVRTTLFQTAQERLKTLPQKRKRSGTFSSSRYGGESEKWLLPGKYITTRAGSLPTPPMDRIVFKQAIAVPVSEDSLLVDIEAVRGAQEILLATGDGNFIPVTLKGSSRSRRQGSAPLALLQVTGYELTPLKIDTDPTIAKRSLAAFGVDQLKEMGSKVRPLALQVKSVDDAGLLTLDGSGLAPGESASPLLDSKDQFVGFLCGKTDALDDKMPDKYLAPVELEDLLKKAATKRSRRTTSRYRSSKAAQAAPKPLKGRTFLILAIVGEKFDKEGKEN